MFEFVIFFFQMKLCGLKSDCGLIWKHPWLDLSDVLKVLRTIVVNRGFEQYPGWNFKMK